MSEQDETYSGYNFGSHVGYGTAAHRAAIEMNGLTPLHRRSFAPIAKFAGLPLRESLSNGKNKNATKNIGDTAKTAAVEYLHRHGFNVLQRNWKTRWCEIDIVAQKEGRIYFVEVKYRKKADQGGGIADTTPTKKRQMKFAAERWMQGRGMSDAARLWWKCRAPSSP